MILAASSGPVIGNFESSADPADPGVSTPEFDVMSVPSHARDVGHVGHRSRAQVRQEGLDRVQRAVQVDVDHALDDLEGGQASVGVDLACDVHDGSSR